MKIRIILVVLFAFSSMHTMAQPMSRPSQYEINTLPEWAKKMYGTNPNVLEVDSLYRNYYRSHAFIKTYHTQYYKKWRRAVVDFIDDQGFVKRSEMEQPVQNRQPSQNLVPTVSNWTVTGPIQVLSNSGVPGKTQSNIYAIDQCAAVPDIMYCGTEPGEVYKSIDGGDTWNHSSMNENFGSGVGAVEVDPVHPDTVFAGADYGVFRSTDGGVTWSNVLVQTGFGANEILVNPANTQLVLAAATKGLFRSTDGGTNWTQLFNQRSYDVKCNAADPSIVYLVKNNPPLIKAEFYISVDSGATWNLQSNGWYNSTDPARNDGGARIGVTPADPQRVYAYLIGESKPNDVGYIGLYRSDDGGITWTLPNGPAGGPYSTAHPNLACGSPTWLYHQGLYNCALMVSETDPDHLLIGGLNLWRSDDGANTFTSVAGYVGGPLDMHVDNQDFRMINGTAWISTDGGIYKSTDFYNSQPEFKMYGVHASDYWGFGSGWNEDVLVGGLYHNGNLAWHENYGTGTFLALGGGEAPTGYVNPGNNRKTYYSDIGGKFLPLTITGAIGNFSIGMSPNETYFSAESSEMEFHPNCYNSVYIGKENKLWRSDDGGASFNLVDSFGTNINNQVKYIEISNNNPDIIYLNQQPASGNTGTLWKTNDGGVTWNTLTIPPGNSRRMLLMLDAVNDSIIWIAYPGGSNGNRIFKSVDGGSTWLNLTTSLLDGESAHSIKSIAGTDGGIYYCSSKSVFYRNNTMTDWQEESTGLPLFFNTNIAAPFYRDGKIRIASYGKGIWESVLAEAPAFPVARIGVDKLLQNVICTNDSFYFEDRSYLNHAGASWSWTFQNGVPATSSLRNPIVHFSTPGIFQATLTITDGNGNSDSDTISVQVDQYVFPGIISEGFEGSFLPSGWEIFNEDNGGQWSVSTAAGGYGTSPRSSIFDNYNIDSQSTIDELRVFADASGMQDPYLDFDVAYAPYGGIYSDTLEVLVSIDCGQTFTSLYKKGGALLGTAPQNQNFFTPTAAQWRTDSVSLLAYSGFSNVMVAFRNIGHWGNAMYLDNININNLNTGIAEAAAFENIHVFPNPVAGGECLNLILPKENCSVILSDMNGKVLLRQQHSGAAQVTIPEHLSTGSYLLQVESPVKIWNLPVVVK